MYIQEAILACQKTDRGTIKSFITREKWSTIHFQKSLQARGDCVYPTDTPDGMVFYSCVSEQYSSRWTPKMEDLLADDWITVDWVGRKVEPALEVEIKMEVPEKHDAKKFAAEVAAEVKREAADRHHRMLNANFEPEPASAYKKRIFRKDLLSSDEKIERQNRFIIGLVFNICLSLITTLLVLVALGII